MAKPPRIGGIEREEEETVCDEKFSQKVHIIKSLRSSSSAFVPHLDTVADKLEDV